MRAVLLIAVALCAGSLLMRPLCHPSHVLSARVVTRTPASISASVVRPSARTDCHDDPPSGGDSCLQQALWGKCAHGFMRGCNISCGRCTSEARTAALRRTLLVSARQSAPCTTEGADAWVMRAMQNKAEFSRVHGMGFSWSGALVDAAYDGAWNKVSLLAAMLRSLLRPERRRTAALEVEWLLWFDWDVIVTDLFHTLPLEEYSERGVRLVVGGDPAGVSSASGSRSDYLKLNTGVLLLHVHNWSLALVERMLARGGRTRAARHRRALEIQQTVQNLCVGCIDDQAVLLDLLHREPDRWRSRTLLERRFLLQGFWEEYAERLAETPQAAPTAKGDAAPLRLVGAAALPPLLQRVHGSTRTPLSVHFAGCQLCSGKAVEKAARCWPAFRRALRFAEDQALRPLGLQHAAHNRTAPHDEALVSMQAMS